MTGEEFGFVLPRHGASDRPSSFENPSRFGATSEVRRPPAIPNVPLASPPIPGQPEGDELVCDEEL